MLTLFPMNLPSFWNMGGENYTLTQIHSKYKEKNQIQIQNIIRDYISTHRLFSWLLYILINSVVKMPVLQYVIYEGETLPVCKKNKQSDVCACFFLF